MAEENNQQQVETQPAQPAQTTEPTQTTQPAQTQEPAAQDQKPVDNAAAQQVAQKANDLGSNKDPKEGSDAAQQPSTPEVVNEKTEFQIPEGMKIDEKKMNSFKAVAKELGLTKEQAQKLVDMDAQNIQNADAAFREMQANWKTQTLKELGENAEQKLGEAAAAFKRFGDDEFVKLLKDTGLENHPAVVRVFRSIGSKIAMDKTVPGTSNGVKSTMTFEEALYHKN